ncbi:MAG: glutathione S-transferase family protein [Deltaproteobacteria bacterium]
MATTLYFSRNPNPRLAVSVARYQNAPVTYEFATPFDPVHSERFRKLNPNLSIPILVEDGHDPLWEADAIACRLSQMTGSDFWRTGADLPDMIRWISWTKANFVAACDMVHFERGTKQRYGLGPVDAGKVAEGMALFHDSARVLDAHLSNRDFLMTCGLSYADFRAASFIPFNAVAGLPLDDYPALAAWSARLDGVSAFSNPFEGLTAPELPPLPA